MNVNLKVAVELTKNVRLGWVQVPLLLVLLLLVLLLVGAGGCWWALVGAGGCWWCWWRALRAGSAALAAK